MISVACLIAKNEGANLGEWLAYYDAIGFSRLIVLDNNSTDDTAEVARRVSSKIYVDLIEWRDVSPFWQVSAYDHVVQGPAKDADWIGFFDADEFLRFNTDPSISSFLQRLAPYKAVGLPWRMYGSSGYEKPPSGLVIEEYNHRAPRIFAPNYHIKSLLRPSAVKRILNPHAAEIVGYEDRWSLAGSDTGYHWPTGEPIFWRDGTAGLAENLPDRDLAWINHYFVKSVKDWEAKIARGYNGWMRDAESFAAYNQNSENDPVPAPLVRAVRDRLANWGLA